MEWEVTDKQRGKARMIYVVLDESRDTGMNSCLAYYSWRWIHTEIFIDMCPYIA